MQKRKTIKMPGKNLGGHHPHRSPRKTGVSSLITPTLESPNALAESGDVCETAVITPEVDLSMPDNFAARVRYARDLRELSQAELSRISEVDPATVYRIEAGKSRAHSSTAKKLAAALKVSAQWLMNGDEHLKPRREPKPRSSGAASSIELPRGAGKTSFSRIEHYLNEALDPTPEYYPAALVHMLAAQGHTLCPVTERELEQLVNMCRAERDLNANTLETRLYMLRMSASNNDPKIRAAFDKAMARQAAETAARMPQEREQREAASGPTTLKKAKARK